MIKTIWKIPIAQVFFGLNTHCWWLKTLKKTIFFKGWIIFQKILKKILNTWYVYHFRNMFGVKINQVWIFKNCIFNQSKIIFFALLLHIFLAKTTKSMTKNVFHNLNFTYILYLSVKNVLKSDHFFLGDYKGNHPAFNENCHNKCFNVHVVRNKTDIMQNNQALYAKKPTIC